MQVALVLAALAIRLTSVPALTLSLAQWEIVMISIDEAR